jgi:two-component system response regulator TctD
MHPTNPPALPTQRPRLRILCAEDELMIGDLLCQQFLAAGHAAEHAADGFAAWERMSGDLEYFDVVITDHRMPGLTGLELVELLRQGSYRGRIVVHSGAMTAVEAANYRALGVDAMVAKGATIAELLATVEAFVVI